MMDILSLPFMRTALLASLLAGNAIAVLGTFVLMRRIAFSGLAVSQLAALGGVIGILMHFHNSFVFALALVLAGLGLLPWLGRNRRVPPEAWVGTLYVLGSAMAVLLLARDPHGESHTLNVFFGNVLTLAGIEVVEAALLLAFVAPLLYAYFNRWVWVSFDVQSAEVAGIRVGRWGALFYAALALSMTFAIHLFGVLLAFSYLILPATAGLLFATRIRSLFIVVPLIATGATLAGFVLSFRMDLPTGPFVAAVLALIAVTGGLFSRLRRR